MTLTTEQCERVKDMLTDWVRRGNKLTNWKCPHCKKKNQTRQPTPDMVSSKGFWDSARECLKCGGISFVSVWPDGKTDVMKM